MAPPPPSLLTTLLFLLSTFLHHTTSTCVPRNPTIYLYPSLTTPSSPPPTTTLHPSQSTTTFSTLSADKEKASFAPQISQALHVAVSGMCDRTTYPDLCRSSVKPHLLDVEGSVDLEHVLEMHLKTGRSQTVAAWEEFVGLAREGSSKKAGSLYSTMLESCKHKYNDSVDGYDAALRALKEGDLATVQINLDAVLSAYDECGSGDAPEDPSADGPWSRHNEALRKLTDNCLDLAKFLK